MIRIPRKRLLTFAGVGVITVLHWLSFYGSIKYANASVALSCLATTSLFTSFLEPLIFRKKISPTEVILGLAVVAGIYIITQATLHYMMGIVLGLISAFLASLFTTLNKRYMGDHHPMAITVTQLGVGFVFVSAIMPLYLSYFPDTELIPGPVDWAWLLVLALLCTSVGYVLALLALKHVSAFTANLSVNLEPVYGIIMASIFFGEHNELSSRFYLGTLIILLSVLVHPLLGKFRKPKTLLE